MTDLELQRRKLELRRALELKKAAVDLLAFTQYTKPDYEVNWHHRVKCAKLNRFIFDPKCRFLMLFEPPRVGKTELVSKRMPALIHGAVPHAKIIAATYNMDLANEMTAGVQEIMDTPRYRDVFPHIRISPPGGKSILKRNSEEHELGMFLGREQKLSKVDAAGLQLGDYRAQGVGGSFSGFGAHYGIIDDPVKNRQDADSPAFRKTAWDWFTSTFRTRLEGAAGKILITLTRWHEDDIAGRIIALMKSNPHYDQYEIVSFPALREDMLNPEDPRKLDESLWRTKFPESEYAALRAGSERDWAALYQQRPAALEGNIIKREWVEERQYKRRPETFEEMAIFCDLTYKPGENSDFAVIECWGRNSTDIYLIDQIRGRMGFAEQLDAIREMKRRWPECVGVYVEEAANGAAVIQTLTKEIMGVNAVKPKTSKEARVHAVEPIWSAMNVWTPHPSIAPWVEVNIHEYLSFPSAKHDDTVDVMTMALTRFAGIGNYIDRLDALSRL